MPARHYSPDGSAVCGLRDVPAERLTADLDAATCGNCLISRRWGMDISARDYKEHYVRFYGPGGFNDRAGQAAPASATTAPQARAALERVIGAELASIAEKARHGAGTSIIAIACRNATEALMRQADNLVRLALAEVASPPLPGKKPGNVG